MQATLQTARAAWRRAPLFLVALLAVGVISADTRAQKVVNWAKAASGLTTGQKVAQAQKLVSNAQKIHLGILKKLKKARDDKDLVAVDCLGEKYSRTKALLFLAEQANHNLREAVTKKNNSSVTHYYIKIAEAEASIRDLEVESNQCWGKQGIYTGKTQISVIQAPNITTGDPTLPGWQDPIIFRPSNASKHF